LGYLAQAPSIFTSSRWAEHSGILETLKPAAESARTAGGNLAELNLTRLAKQKAYTLSGGERRKLEITRSLVTNPSFLLMDEPFAGVDPLAVADIQDIIRKLRDRNIGILITDHNVLDTLKITQRAYIILDGQILLSGTSRELV
jgi:lipopolysaccharide export system ATP-binding protein